MKLHDQHVHSKYSVDSNQELEAYFQKASLLGCEYFVTTDHIDFNLTESNNDWTVDYKALKEDLRKMHQKYSHIIPLLGVEMGYRRDYLDSINQVLQSESFDLVNLSIHDVKDIDFYWSKYYIKFGVEYVMDVYFDEMIYATSTFDNFDVLSHLDYGFKTVYEMDNNYKISKYEEKIIQVLNNLIKKDKTLEINTKVQETINDDEHTKYLLKLYKKLGGCNITLSSDSHEVERYLSSFDRYVRLIKECGFDHLVYYVKRKKHIYNI